MGRKALIVIDMQEDFVNGALGTKEARDIVENVKVEMEQALRAGHRVICTRDTHYDNYLETNEGKHLPVAHCINGTPGWEVVAKLLDAIKGQHVESINKETFGYLGWADYNFNDFDEIKLVGVCTDICVVSNALILKAMYPEIKIVVDSKCCAGVTPDSHGHALETMKMCQIEII